MRKFGASLISIVVILGALEFEALGQTMVVPSVTASERYDSNVFSTSKQLLSGLRLRGEDYVTSVVPQVSLMHKGNYVIGFIQGGATGEKYVNNPGLDYVGYNGTVSADLTPSVRRLDPNASLYVRGSTFYTPQVPGFLGTSADAQSQNPLIRGIQVTRTNTLASSGTVGGGYRVSPTSSLFGSYTYSSVSFGSEVGPTRSVQLFNTNTHNANLGVAKTLSPLDTVSIRYGYSIAEQPGADNFKTHAVSGAWSRVLTPSWSSNVSGGVQIFEPQRSDSGVVLIEGGKLAPTGSFSLFYKTKLDPLIGGRSEGDGAGFLSTSGSSALSPQGMVPGVPTAMSLPGSTSFGINYSVGVYPGYGQQTGAMISHLVSMQAAYGLSDRMVVGGSVGYSKSDSVSNGAAGNAGQQFSFTSVNTTATISYLLTSNFRLALIHSFTDFRNDAAPESSFQRHTGMLLLSYVFGAGFNSSAAMFSSNPPASGMQGGESGAEKK